MKHPRRLSSGFTLVELLVVIGIIAVLAAVVTVAAGSAINAAKRAKAANTANQIQTAVINFYTEYGVYPLTAGAASTDEFIDGTQAPSSDVQNLMFALCGNTSAYQPAAPINNTGGVSNPRNISFLTLKRSDVDNNGVPLNPFTSGGNDYYFSIVIDGDYDGIAGDSGGASGNIPDFAAWQTNKSIQKMSGNSGITAGVGVWACCDPKNLATPNNSTLPNFWVHTY